MPPRQSPADPLREIHQIGADVLIEPLELSRPGIRDDPGSLRKQPRKRDLRRGGMLLLAEALEQMDHRHVGGARVRCEPWRDGAEIVGAEGRARVDLARQKSRTERAEGNEAESELGAGGE